MPGQVETSRSATPVNMENDHPEKKPIACFVAPPVCPPETNENFKLTHELTAGMWLMFTNLPIRDISLVCDPSSSVFGLHREQAACVQEGSSG